MQQKELLVMFRFDFNKPSVQYLPVYVSTLILRNVDYTTS